MEEQGKPLAKWRLELKTLGKRHWLVFYSQMVGRNCSSPPRLYKALNNYGFWPLFDAIVASADKEFENDPLNYVLKIAANKWKESEEEIEQDEEYEQEISEAKKLSREQNEALKKKLGSV